MTETPPVDYIAQANLIHESGPAVTPPSTLYFTYLRTDGDTIVGPATHAEQYLRLGYTITGQQTIEDFTTFTEQAAKTEAKAASRGEHAEAPKTKAS